MQITVCDICGKKETKPVYLTYDRVYNGTDYDSPTEQFDLCADHLNTLLCYLLKNNTFDKNLSIIKYIQGLKSKK
jgi:hypothetical protein